MIDVKSDVFSFVLLGFQVFLQRDRNKNNKGLCRFSVSYLWPNFYADASTSCLWLKMFMLTLSKGLQSRKTKIYGQANDTPGWKLTILSGSSTHKTITGNHESYELDSSFLFEVFCVMPVIIIFARSGNKLSAVSSGTPPDKSISQQVGAPNLDPQGSLNPLDKNKNGKGTRA